METKRKKSLVGTNLWHNAVSSAAVSGNPLVSFVLIALLIYEHLRENTGVKTHLALTSTHIPLTTSTVLAFVTETYVNNRWFGRRPHTCGLHTCAHRRTNIDTQQEERPFLKSDV